MSEVSQEKPAPRTLTPNEAFAKIGRTEGYDSHPTRIRGVSVKTLPGAVSESQTLENVVPYRTQRAFFNLSGKYFRQKRRIAALTAQHEEVKDGLKLIAQESPLRGIRTEDGDIDLTVYESVTMDGWRDRVFRRVLGSLYGNLVTPQLRLTISIPPGSTTPEGEPLTPEYVGDIMVGTFATLLSVSPKKAASSVEAEVRYRYEAEEIGRRVNEGQLDIPENAIDVAPLTWTVSPNTK